MKTWTCLLLFLLTGCASVRYEAPRIEGLFQDTAFAAPSEPVGAGDLFTLSPEMQAYLRSAAFATHLRKKGSENGLVDALYSKGDLMLEYESSITRTAAQTYAARSGNCLSLVIMTAAFAKELGMKVRYNHVFVEENWTRNGALYLVSSHVNLSLGQRSDDLLRGSNLTRTLTIDFLPPDEASKFHSRELEETDIIAMYMNNRAAEALVQNRVDDAYWWARAALTQQPALGQAYNTLGVIYQRKGELVQAERVFLAVLAREPENVVVMQNLVPVLNRLGKQQEAAAMTARIAQIEPNPPFKFFNEGMLALEHGEFAAAKALFTREVKRAPYNDEFHFWLAVACLRLGDAKQAREQLALAYDTSTRRDNKEVYSAKLAYLRSLHSQYGNGQTAFH
ncbi:tetratricopeptide repeat protein [Massilia horti]|uniref:Tetratricopeptide repeat protein n=1 Tax=Massilia horti TaxID=2562153 RepID=A0A4Y9T935_9BURK|nr:tetratricopeptide repeat protein [Massilia horti]TFW35820.1 tetratricopeptide repeat protein [Massilia horti]